MQCRNRLHANAHRWFAFLALAAYLAAGCRDDGLKLGEVSGRVTLDGDPVSGAFITFHPQFPGRPSMAKTDEDGYYELRFNPSRWGALVGEHHVTVSTEDRTADDRLIPEVIPEKYRGENFIAVTVESGSQVHDFELTTGDE